MRKMENEMKKVIRLAIIGILSLAFIFAMDVNRQVMGWGPLPALVSSGLGCDSNTLFLIHSDSTDGSTVFQDSGGSATCPHTITANGNVHHETDQKYFGATSVYFDGTTDTLQVATPDTDWAFGTGNFTIDMWIYKAAGNMAIIGNTYNTNGFWHIRVVADFLVFNYGVGTETTTNFTITANTWTHIAVERHGNNLNMFKNGTISTVIGDLTGINFSGLADLYIGNGFGGPNDYSGYIDEIRISNTARYGGVNFSVPTSSYCQ